MSNPQSLEHHLEIIHNITDDKTLIKTGKIFIEELLIDLYHKNTNIAFWGYVFNYVKKEIDLTLPAPMAVTFRNNQFIMLINPKNFMTHWTVENIQAIIIHEGYHLLMNHLSLYQQQMKNPQLAELINIATDCEINQLIEGLPPEGVTLDFVKQLLDKSDVKAKAGSAYYLDLLLQNNKNNNNGDNDGNGDNGSRNNNNQSQIDSHNEWASAGTDSGSYTPIEEATKQVINQATKDIKSNRGRLPANLEELIQKLNKPAQIKWQRLIEQSVGKQIYNKRDTITRLNRRQPFRLDKKGRINNRIQPIIFAFDTSGSIEDHDLEVFYNEAYQLSKKKQVPIEIIQFDTDITNIETITRPNQIKFNTYGRGGTSFQPIFDYLKDNKYDRDSMLFIFTDGYGEYKIDMKGYHKTNWILIDSDYLSVQDNTKPIIHVTSKDVSS